MKNQGEIYMTYSFILHFSNVSEKKDNTSKLQENYKLWFKTVNLAQSSHQIYEMLHNKG